MGFLANLTSRLRNRSATGGLLWPSIPMNWWQTTRPLSVGEYGLYGPVYACWSIISQEISRVPLYHQRYSDDGTGNRVMNQAPARIFRNPNPYQTRSDFLMYLTRSLLAAGNAYAVAVRNNRFEVAALYPANPRMVFPYISEDDGSVYYRFSDTDAASLAQIDPNDFWVPARDMLHIRLFTPGHPLVGETPLVAATSPVQAGMAINQQLAAFFTNAARPSGIIRHPGKLEPAAVQRIKERFVSATTGEHAGSPVVFPEAMEWQSLTMNAVDAELIASAKLSQLQIAQIYRVPPFFLGDLGEAKFATVESLTRWFINSGLGFYLDHISDALTKFFELPANEEILFDYEKALLQSDTKTYFEALEVATRSGVMSPNEARKLRNLPPVENGDEPRVQQQLVPLSFGMQLDPTPDPAPAPTAEPDPVDPQTAKALALLERVESQQRVTSATKFLLEKAA